MTVAIDLRDALLRGRNADGGWGYRAGNRSRLEPTCWALLGLRDGGASAILRHWPHRDGLLLERHGGSINVSFHGLALITLKRLATEHSAGNGTLVAALVDVRGKQIPQAKEYVQDNSLQAWPWMVGTFSWVEPTSWCLLALKH